MKLRVVYVVMVLGLVAAACASGDDGAEGEPDMATGMPSMDMSPSGDFAFGRPGDASEADRTIEVSQLDSFAFEPAEIEVEMGETVTFSVTNEGKSAHEFVLGDDTVQQDHESEMQEMGGEMMPDGPNAISVEAGETKSLTWTFTEAGEVLFGCHVSGHFANGMVGSISVSA